MNQPLLHVFRNTPFGRETLLQSVYSCHLLQLPLDIFIPEDGKFLLYFGGDVVQVDLDKSYLIDPTTAQMHAEQTISLGAPVKYQFISPKSYTATGLPDLSPQLSIMACPRSMSDVTARIGLGHIGQKVRRILQISPFPILIPGAAFKPWNSLVALDGGSQSAANALQLAIDIHQRSKIPLQIISIGNRNNLEKMLVTQGLIEQINKFDWQIFPGSSLQKHLYQIPHDTLVILGAYGHGSIKALFGSSMEMIQSQLPNPLLVVGPNYKPN